MLIPTHNRREILARTLESLAAVRIPAGVNVDLTVVANGCTDGTEKMVAEHAPSLPFPARCVVEPELGVAHARNRCVKEGTGQIFAFLDDDIWADPAWLEGLLEVFESQPADFVMGRVTLWWEAVQPPEWLNEEIEAHLSAKDHGAEVKELRRGGDAISANLAFTREAAARIGPFKTGLGRKGGKGLLGGEETDWVARGLAEGLRMFYAPKAWVKHWVPAHRIELPYLDGVAFGHGYGHVIMKESFSKGEVLSLWWRGLFLRLKCRLRETGCALSGNRKARMHHRMRRMKGRGWCQASWERFWGAKPPNT